MRRYLRFHTLLLEAGIDRPAKANGNAYKEAIHDALLAQQPDKHCAAAKELGAVTVLLARELAASIAGIALPIDGAGPHTEG